MKLLRYGDIGHERPGLLDASGQIRDLTGIVADIGGATLGAQGLERLRALDPETRGVLHDLLLELQQDARQRAEASWRSRKPPLAAY